MSISTIARNAGLTVAATSRSITRLTEIGVLVRVMGTKGRGHFSIDYQNPMGCALKVLFESEQSAYENIIDSLSILIDKIPEIDGAYFTLDETRVISLSISALPKYWKAVRSKVRKSLLNIEKVNSTIIEVEIYSDRKKWLETEERYFLKIDTENVIRKPNSPNLLTHKDRDLQSLRRSRGIANLIRKDPSLILRAQKHIVGKDFTGTDMDEWFDILKSYSPFRVADFIESQSPRAVKLRQSSPFIPILDEHEREIIGEYNNKDEN